MNRTETQAHGMDTLVAQRVLSMAKLERMLRGALFCAQLLLGSALYVLPRAATASYQAVALLFAPAFVLYGCARAVTSRRGDARPGKGALLLLLPLLFDAQLCLLALCELTQDYILPEAPRTLYALVVALCVGASLYGAGNKAVPRIARLLRAPLIAAFVYCVITVIGKGDVGYFFPILGRGIGVTARSALFLCGSAWVCALPAGLSAHKPAIPEKPVREWPAVLVPLLLCVALMATLAFLQPSYGLTRGMGFGARMLLIMELSPSALTWSLMLAGLLFLFLLALSGAIRFACDILAPYSKRRLWCWLLPLLCVPLAAISGPAETEILISLAPYRAVVAAASLAYLFIEERKKA